MRITGPTKLQRLGDAIAPGIVGDAGGLLDRAAFLQVRVEPPRFAGAEGSHGLGPYLVDHANVPSRRARHHGSVRNTTKQGSVG